MRKIIGSFLAIFVVSLLFAAPASAGTAMGEDSFQECSYPRMADLLLMRPVGLFGLGMSTVIFTAASPFTLVFAGGEFPVVFDDMVARPAGFLFARPLGQCTIASL